jgi:hypothetical protein
MIDSTPIARNLFHLCDRIGPRFAGTPGYRRAAEYMRSQFEQYGLQRTHLEPFTFNAWRRGEPARLAICGPVDQTINCYALPYAASTPAGGVRADLVNVGSGTAEAIEAVSDRIAGRFALVIKPGRHRMDVYAACVNAKAAGFIFAAGADGMGLISGSVSDAEPGAIPAVSIGREDALKLARFAESQAVSLHLTTQHTIEPDTTWNVIGELPGRTHPDEFVIVGGHLDSHEIGPGAYDNGAGAVQVMEIARLLSSKRDRLDRTVRFIGFAAEEIGLLGSKHHANAHADQMPRVRAMFNCDMPGLCPPWVVGYHTCPDAESLIAALSKTLAIDLIPRAIPHGHSDHYPFTLHGVPALELVGSRPTVGGPKFAHMAGDTPEKIPLDLLADSAALAAEIVLHLANHPPARE